MGSFIIPPPWLTLLDTFNMLGIAHTWIQILITLSRVALGFFLSFILGSAVGILSGASKELKAFFRPLILLLQGIPPILWAIPLILIFGTGHISPILVIALICFPLVAMNISEGMTSVPRDLEEMLKVFTPGLYPKLRELIFPHLKPFIAASLKLGIVLGIKASVVGEYFGSNNGIGFQIQAAYQSLQVRNLFSWGMLLVFLIIFSNKILSRLLRIKERDEKAGERKTSECKSETLEIMKKSFLRDLSHEGIKLENVSYTYPAGVEVLRNISLTIEPEEIAVISGESGTGKTTLLKAASCLLEPDSGRITVPDKIGLVFQDDRLLPWRSNAWNAALPLFYSGNSMEESLCFASYLLTEVGLSNQEAGYPEELSGGMKKRLCFARCFARFPEAVLLDEPFTGLHEEARRLLWMRLFDLLELHPVPVIIVTHFPLEVPVKKNCRFYTLRSLTNSGCGSLNQLIEKSRFQKEK